MKKRLQNNEYFFSVEGETEIWYLKHLQEVIRKQENRKVNPVITAKKTSPMKFLKTFPSLSFNTITAIYDVEEPIGGCYIQFESFLREMSDVKKTGKTMVYELGYSNVDFELWIIFHKKDFFRTITKKSDYLREINNGFSSNFAHLNEYKAERNFKTILDMITLEDIKNAIYRAETIENQRNTNSVQLNSYGYKWFSKNPSLSLHHVIRKIITECGV